MDMETSLPAPLEDLVLAQIRSTYAAQRKGGIALIAVMGIIAAIAYFGLSGNDQNLWVLGAGCMLLGLIPLALSARDPKKAKSLRMIRTRWADIVWLYVHRVTGSANAAFVRCGLSDGKFFMVPCEVGQEQFVLKALADFVPHASAGFTPKLDATFRASPESLRVS